MKPMPLSFDPYIYRAACRPDDVYDGDTVRVDLDLGLHVRLVGQRLRLRGIDTPELPSAEGYAARDVLRQLVDESRGEVIVRTHRDRTGKYGRWLADLFVRVDGGDALLHVNRELVDRGLARTIDL